MICSYRDFIMKNEDTKVISLKWFLIALGISLLIWLIFPSIVSTIFHPDDTGKFGDMFGSLNALFASFAFVGLIFAILLQREELKLQREELRLAREELTHQTRVISKQLEAMQDSMNFEKEREYRESEPIFKCIDGESSGGRKILNIENYGGIVTNLKVFELNPLDERTVHIESGQVLDKNGRCRIIIVGDYPNNHMLIKIRYTDRLGTTNFKEFAIPEGEFSIEERW